MKVCVTYKLDSSRPLTTIVVMCKRFSTKDYRISFYEEINSMYPFKSIDLDEIAEYNVIGEVVLDTQTENYLNEYGNVVNLYRAMSVNARTGQCFFDALNTMDQYLLVQAGSKLRLYGDDNGLDSPVILQAIEFLEDAKKNYPENHPLRELSKR